MSYTLDCKHFTYFILVSCLSCFFFYILIKNKKNHITSQTLIRITFRQKMSILQSNLYILVVFTGWHHFIVDFMQCFWLNWIVYFLCEWRDNKTNLFIESHEKNKNLGQSKFTFHISSLNNCLHKINRKTIKISKSVGISWIGQMQFVLWKYTFLLHHLYLHNFYVDIIRTHLIQLFFSPIYSHDLYHEQDI